MKTEFKNGEKIYFDYVQRVIASAIKSLEQTYQIYEESGLDLTGVKDCANFDISYLSGKKVDAHLVISFAWEFSDSSNAVAYASPCYSKSSNGRFIMGVIVLNLK